MLATRGPAPGDITTMPEPQKIPAPAPPAVQPQPLIVPPPSSVVAQPLVVPPPQLSVAQPLVVAPPQPPAVAQQYVGVVDHGVENAPVLYRAVLRSGDAQREVGRQIADVDHKRDVGTGAKSGRAAEGTASPAKGTGSPAKGTPAQIKDTASQAKTTRRRKNSQAQVQKKQQPAVESAGEKNLDGNARLLRVIPDIAPKTEQDGRDTASPTKGTASPTKTARRRKNSQALVQNAPQPAPESAGEKNLDDNGGSVNMSADIAPKTDQDGPKGQDLPDEKKHSEAADPQAPTGDDKTTDVATPLLCFLCGRDRDAVKRLQNPTLGKFMKIPVPENPFAGVDPDNPPKTLALCHKDRVWINNLWVSGRRFNLSGIWTRRNPVTGEALSKGRARRSGSKKTSGQTGKRQSRGDSVAEESVEAEPDKALTDKQDIIAPKTTTPKTSKSAKADDDKALTDKLDKIAPKKTISKTPKSVKADAGKTLTDKQEKSAKTGISKTPRSVKADADKALTAKQDRVAPKTMISKTPEVRSGSPRSGTAVTRRTRPTNGGDQPTPSVALASSKRPPGEGTEVPVKPTNATRSARVSPRHSQTQPASPVEYPKNPKQDEIPNNDTKADSGLSTLENRRIIYKKRRDVFGSDTVEDHPQESPTKRRHMDPPPSQEQCIRPKFCDTVRERESAFSSMAETAVCLIPVKKARSDTELMRVARPADDFRSVVLQLQKENSDLRREMLQMRLVIENHAAQLRALDGTVQTLLGCASPTL